MTFNARSLSHVQEPSPADIRPLHILKETLQLLKRKWKENHNYAYALDQFKSMRQDLTVSRLKAKGHLLLLIADE